MLIMRLEVDRLKSLLPSVVTLLSLYLRSALCISPSVYRERSGEHRLKEVLLRNYDPTTRPVRNDKTPIRVQIAISLYHILDTKWTDEYLRWNESEYGGVKSIRVPADKIWNPDLIIQNFAGDKFNDYMMTNAIVSPDGTVLWLFPALIKTYCTLNVKYFPFDTQYCQIVFISWTHSGQQLDIFYNGTDMANAVYYVSKNQEWTVSQADIKADRKERKYACCPELYPDVTFTIRMRRGSLFYIINLITPCFLIFIISFLGFFLPVESGEKVNLEITILLALVVFMLRVGETMPPTPDSIPILGMYFASTMAMVSIALVMAVIVTNIYAKKNSSERCPTWAVLLASKFFPPHYLPQRQTSSLSLASTICGEIGTTPTTSLPAMSFERPTRIHRQKTYDIDSSNLASGSRLQTQTGNKRSSAGWCQPRATVSGMTSSSGDWDDMHTYGVGASSGGCGNRMSVSTVGAAERRAKRMQRSGASSSCDSSAGRQSSEESGGDGALNQQEKQELAQAKAEWRLVALFADRLFLWIFTALSVTVHVSLFVQMMPRENVADEK